MGRRQEREAPDMAAFAGRVARAMVRRAAEGDLETLSALTSMARDVEAATAAAAAALVEAGYSWGDVGRELGITRQAAWQRFGRAGNVEVITFPNGSTLRLKEARA